MSNSWITDRIFSCFRRMETNRVLSLINLGVQKKENIQPEIIDLLTHNQLQSFITELKQQGLIPSLHPIPTTRPDLAGEVIAILHVLSPNRMRYDQNRIIQQHRTRINRVMQVLNPTTSSGAGTSATSTGQSKADATTSVVPRPLSTPPATRDEMLMTFVSSLRRVRLSCSPLDSLVRPIFLEPFEASPDSPTIFRAKVVRFAQTIALEPNEVIQIRCFAKRPDFTYKDGIHDKTVPCPTNLPLELVTDLFKMPPSDLVQDIISSYTVIPWVLGDKIELTKFALWIRNSACQELIPTHPIRQYQSQIVGKVSKRGFPLLRPIQIARSLKPEDSIEIAQLRDVHFRGFMLGERIRKLTIEECIARIKSKPKIDIIASPSLPNQCHVCGITQHLFRCTACRNVLYCGKEHQLQDWNNHKTRCKQLRKQLALEEAKNSAVNDEEIEVVTTSQQEKVVLVCPLTLVRIKVPVRSIYCTHLRCFELETWVKLNSSERATTSNCPICTKEILFEELRISEKMEHALETLPKSVEEVRLGPNGVYVAYEDPSAPALDDDESSDDYQQPIKKPYQPESSTSAVNPMVQLWDPQTAASGANTGQTQDGTTTAEATATAMVGAAVPSKPVEVEVIELD